jgi:hypothetical protein
VSAGVVGLLAMAGPYRARLQPAFNTPAEAHSQVLANDTDPFYTISWDVTRKGYAGA